MSSKTLEEWRALSPDKIWTEALQLIINTINRYNRSELKINLAGLCFWLEDFKCYNCDPENGDTPEYVFIDLKALSPPWDKLDHLQEFILLMQSTAVTFLIQDPSIQLPDGSQVFSQYIRYVYND